MTPPSPRIRLARRLTVVDAAAVVVPGVVEAEAAAVAVAVGGDVASRSFFLLLILSESTDWRLFLPSKYLVPFSLCMIMGCHLLPPGFFQLGV
jgi:hypothetical protein